MSFSAEDQILRGSQQIQQEFGEVVEDYGEDEDEEKSPEKVQQQVMFDSDSSVLSGKLTFMTTLK